MILSEKHPNRTPLADYTPANSNHSCNFYRLCLWAEKFSNLLNFKSNFEEKIKIKRYKFIPKFKYSNKKFDIIEIAEIVEIAKNLPKLYYEFSFVVRWVSGLFSSPNSQQFGQFVFPASFSFVY